MSIISDSIHVLECVSKTLSSIVHKAVKATKLSDAAPGQRGMSRPVSTLDVPPSDLPGRELTPFTGTPKPTAPQPLNVRIGHYDLFSLVGYGASGAVIFAQDKRTKVDSAVKVVSRSKLQSRSARDSLFNEVLMLQALSNDEECRWFFTIPRETFVDAHNVYVVMEYLHGGTVWGALNDHGGSFPEDLVRFYAAEIVCGVNFLHERGVIHRDLKPENLLIDSTGHIVIADLGLAHVLVHGIPDAYCGTAGYIAPEMYLGIPYGVEVDVWSLGCCLYEMLFGIVPFYGRNYDEQMARTLRCNPEMPRDSGISYKMEHLLSRLLIKDGTKRVHSKLIRHHMLFKGIDWDVIRNRSASPSCILEPVMEHAMYKNTISYSDLIDPSQMYSDWNIESSGDHIFFSPDPSPNAPRRPLPMFYSHERSPRPEAEHQSETGVEVKPIRPSPALTSVPTPAIVVSEVSMVDAPSPSRATAAVVVSGDPVVDAPLPSRAMSVSTLYVPSPAVSPTVTVVGSLTPKLSAKVSIWDYGRAIKHAIFQGRQSLSLLC